MSNYKRVEQKSLQKRFLFILGLVMFAFYFILGLVLIVWSEIPLNLDRKYRILLGVILIAYSILRGYRVIQNQKDLNDED